MDRDRVIKITRNWVETFVVGFNLCPFAKKELVTGALHFSVSEATTEEDLLADLQAGLKLLVEDKNKTTTLLIHPNVLQDFYDYNQFLDVADALLVDMKLEGVYQIASFHPNYQFSDTQIDDAENYTNKSPYPMLHLLPESLVEKAIEAYPNIDGIPEKNAELLASMGSNALHLKRSECLDKDMPPN